MNFLFITGCNSKSSVTEQLKLQSQLIPTMIDIEHPIYVEAIKQNPSELTRKIYDTSISKGMFLQRMLKDGKNNDQFESELSVREINSLCLMSKFLLSEKYKNAANLEGEAYKDFYEWLSKKQIKWEELVSKESPNIFDVHCMMLKN